jgi:putative endonuclease
MSGSNNAVERSATCGPNIRCAYTRHAHHEDGPIMTWFLYLIECADGSIYTGIAVDVAARYAAHQKGKGAKYTRSRPPRRLLAVVAYPDRSSASRAEYAMKQRSKSEKRRFCLQRNALWQIALPLAQNN